MKTITQALAKGPRPIAEVAAETGYEIEELRQVIHRSATAKFEKKEPGDTSERRFELCDWDAELRLYFPKFTRPRKTHLCRLCGMTIKQGDECARWAGPTPDAGYHTSHAHPECFRVTLIEGWNDGDWERFDQGEMERPVPMKPDPLDYIAQLLYDQSKRETGKSPWTWFLLDDLTKADFREKAETQLEAWHKDQRETERMINWPDRPPRKKNG